MMPAKERLAQHAEAIRALGRRTVESVIAIGRELTEAREICPHGKWRSWLKRELQLSEATARRFMQTHDLARSSKSVNLTQLPVSSVYLLAQPSTPVEVQREIMDAVAGGEKLAHKQVTAVLKGYYAPKPRAVPKAKPRPLQTHLSPVPSPSQQELIEQIIDLFKQLDVHGQRSTCVKLRNIFSGRA